MIQIIQLLTALWNVHCVASSFAALLSFAPHLNWNRTSMVVLLVLVCVFCELVSAAIQIGSVERAIDEALLLHCILSCILCSSSSFFVQQFIVGGGGSGQSASIHLDSIFIYSLPFRLSTIVLFRFAGSFLLAPSLSRFTFFFLSLLQCLFTFVNRIESSKKVQAVECYCFQTRISIAEFQWQFDALMSSLFSDSRLETKQKVFS